MLKSVRPLILLTIVALTGCDDSLAFQRATVSGTVTYKGKPLESGLITFMPDTEMKNGQVAGRPVFLKIENGKYAVPTERGVTVGKNRVEILSYRKTGRTIKEEGNSSDEQLQFIPDSYNTNSTLSADIKPNENTINFDLK